MGRDFNTEKKKIFQKIVFSRGYSTERNTVLTVLLFLQHFNCTDASNESLPCYVSTEKAHSQWYNS